MKHEYKILDPANILLPEEIFYLNLTHHHMEYHVHAPGSHLYISLYKHEYQLLSAYAFAQSGYTA